MARPLDPPDLALVYQLALTGIASEGDRNYLTDVIEWRLQKCIVMSGTVLWCDIATWWLKSPLEMVDIVTEYCLDCFVTTERHEYAHYRQVSRLWYHPFGSFKYGWMRSNSSNPDYSKRKRKWDILRCKEIECSNE